ncbi:hypothetical protein CAXC1_340003 [Candidatus Xenohaliotis californiensis]|uniref:Uncharacterized protein n=1 Tax=Candidatus Xenohaliotis californiensis TaxID=84677 RepID=A0ABM9N8V9_9RICK|nr:hypothetical protein CAXC1_340003 [Candidatus Xenohaliotis californiensis]
MKNLEQQEIKDLDAKTIEQVKREGHVLHKEGLRYLGSIKDGTTPVPSAAVDKSQEKKSGVDR